MSSQIGKKKGEVEKEEIKEKEEKEEKEEKVSIKFCPGCGQPIEKKGGCNFIKCPICKTRWCFVCNKEKGTKNENDKCFDRKHRSHR
jgi:hypothetical protein